MAASFLESLAELQKSLGPRQTIAQIFDLTGKGAIVTGGAMGIGQATAMRLAEAGASVMIADINLEAASQTVEQIKASGGKAEAIRADVTNIADAAKVVQATVEAFGSLDILVNNAGIFPFSPTLYMSEEIWDKILNTNLKGLFFYSQTAAREMIKAGRRGRIVNIASMDALHPTYPEMAHYEASKGGVVMLTKALALELAPHNILVNAIAPGCILTPGAMMLGETLAARGESIEEWAEKLWKRFPLGRMGEPDEIARVVLFLVSAAADFMTGSLVLVDGGFLIS